jgi:hypothetical protein
MSTNLTDSVGVLAGASAGHVAAVRGQRCRMTTRGAPNVARKAPASSAAIDNSRPGSSGCDGDGGEGRGSLVSPILEGTESYALEGEQARTVNVGDVLHESPMQVHTAENLSPVKLLVIRVAEKGKPATVSVQK